MTGAMYAGIAGLRTHMSKLNVIGNNVANINTYSYKSGRAVFQTSIYTSLASGSNGTDTVGGKNPSQIGYGSTLTSVDIDLSPGTFAYSGKSTDCMLTGDGFFLVGDKTLSVNFDASNPESFKSLTLTRLGDFEFKADGYLTDNLGSVVYGFLSTGIGADGKTPIISDQLVPIRLPRLRSEYVYDTGENSGQPIEDGMTETDIQQGLQDGKIILKKTVVYPTVQPAGDENQAAEGYNGRLRDGDANLPYVQLEGIKYDENTGKITGTVKETQEIVTIGYIPIGNVTNPNGVTQISNTYYRAEEGAGALSINMLGGAQSEVYDASRATSYTTQQGAEVAKPTGIRYVNQSLLNTGAEGEGELQPAEGAEITSAGKLTKILGNGLEMGKTDLATEISEMITTQRGYQANTRIITVTDAMLEELVNMKR